MAFKTTEENLAQEAADIGSVWDAAVAYSISNSNEDRERLAELIANWKQHHPIGDSEER